MSFCDQERCSVHSQGPVCVKHGQGSEVLSLSHRGPSSTCSYCRMGEKPVCKVPGEWLSAVHCQNGQMD